MNELFPVRLTRYKALIVLPLLLLLAATLSSCATLKKGDCLEGDWASIGYKDGAAGHRSTVQLEGHKRACARYKVAPNKAVYDIGYKKGLSQFCTKPSAYAHGVKGKEYFGVCPASTQKGVIGAYVMGLDVAIHNLRDEMHDLRRKQLRLEMRHGGRGRHHESDRVKIEKSDKGKGHDRNKKQKELENRIDSLDSAISSRRSRVRKMRGWHDMWVGRLSGLK